MKAKEVRNIK